LASIAETIDAQVPLEIAFENWTRVDLYPCFMRHVDGVRRLDGSRLEWTAKIAGVPITWITEITRQDPGRCIAWLGEFGQASVKFESLGAAKTRMTLEIDHSTEERGRDSRIRIAPAPAAGDLWRFKEFVEAHAPVQLGSDAGSAD
jgi:uncharacterized membrane protein